MWRRDAADATSSTSRGAAEVAAPRWWWWWRPGRRRVTAVRVESRDGRVSARLAWRRRRRRPIAEEEQARRGARGRGGARASRREVAPREAPRIDAARPADRRRRGACGRGARRRRKPGGVSVPASSGGGPARRGRCAAQQARVRVVARRRAGARRPTARPVDRQAVDAERRRRSAARARATWPPAADARRHLPPRRALLERVVHAARQVALDGVEVARHRRRPERALHLLVLARAHRVRVRRRRLRRLRLELVVEERRRGVGRLLLRRPPRELVRARRLHLRRHLGVAGGRGGRAVGARALVVAWPEPRTAASRAGPASSRGRPARARRPS